LSRHFSKDTGRRETYALTKVNITTALQRSRTEIKEDVSFQSSHYLGCKTRGGTKQHKGTRYLKYITCNAHATLIS